MAHMVMFPYYLCLGQCQRDVYMLPVVAFKVYVYMSFLFKKIDRLAYVSLSYRGIHCHPVNILIRCHLVQKDFQGIYHNL